MTHLAFGRAAAARRDDVYMSANGVGYYAETCDYQTLAGSSLTSTQVVYGMGVGLLAGDVVSNMTVALQTVGSGVTLAKIALYTSGGTRLAVSADQSSVMNGTTGMKTIALGPYTVTVDGFYYAAVLAVGGTQPTLMQGRGAVNAFQAVGSGFAQAVVQGSQADMPSPATFSGAANARTFWIAIS